MFSYENAFYDGGVYGTICVSQRTVQRYLENEELDKIIVKTKNGRKRYITVESVAKFIRKRSQEVKNNE